MKTFTSEAKIAMQGLTFDDVLLVPGYSGFKRDDIMLSTKLTKNISLQVPLVSSPMDTVTEAPLAITLAELGGIGIIHRNLSVQDQATQVQQVKAKNLMVGAAVGASAGVEERIKALVAVNVNVIVVDSAHGNAANVIETIQLIKK
jgi:IMP dehydrogenase